MNFDFTNEQTMLRDSVSRLLSQGYSFEQRQKILRSEAGTAAEVWGQFGEMGLLALPLPEDAGGMGGSVTDVVAISELFGASLVVEPYLGSIILAGKALALAPDHAVAADWLARILGGTALGAFAYEEGQGTPHPSTIGVTAGARGGRHALSGEKNLVLGGAQADVLVVAARLAGGEPGLFVVDPGGAGVSIGSYATVDGRRAANIRFDDAAGDLILADAAAAIEGLVRGAIMVLAAEAVGAMGMLLEMTTRYAATRHQFGVAIGSFQVIAHRMADMKIAYVKARSTLLYTTALAESGQAAARDISLLKAQVGRLGRIIGESAVQIHGGVGMADELAVGHYLKRLLAIDAMFGSSEYHLRRVGATG